MSDDTLERKRQRNREYMREYRKRPEVMERNREHCRRYYQRNRERILELKRARDQQKHNQAAVNEFLEFTLVLGKIQ